MRNELRLARRGSVVLMVVGLLVLLAMIGMTFVIVSHMDRRDAVSLANAVPMRKVSQGMLQRVGALLVEDLYFAQAANADLPYEGVKWQAAAPANAVDDLPLYLRMVDHPAIDRWLSSTEMEWDNGVNPPRPYLRFLSNIFPERNPPVAPSLWEKHPSPGGKPGFTCQPYSGKPIPGELGCYYVDTDGDKFTDSMLMDTGVRDRDGNAFLAAVRVVDLSGKVNVNYASRGTTVFPYKSVPNAREMLPLGMQWGAGTGVDFALPGSDLAKNRAGLDLAQMPMGLNRMYDAFQARPLNQGRIEGSNQGAYAYSFDDLLGLLWLEPNLNSATCAAQGRLFGLLSTKQSPDGTWDVDKYLGTAAQGYLDARRRCMTTWNSYRQLVPQYELKDKVGANNDAAYDLLPMRRRAELNTAIYEELFTGFYNAIPRNAFRFTEGGDNAQMDEKRRQLAAQLAVNVMDFRDKDEEVTFRPAPNPPPNADPRTIPPLGPVYGVERQPFITEIFHKSYRKGGTTKYCCAVEIWNPYKMPLPANTFTFQYPVGTKLVDVAMAPNSRLVFRSDTTIQTGAASTAQIYEVPAMVLAPAPTSSFRFSVNRTVNGKVIQVTAALLNNDALRKLDDDPLVDGYEVFRARRDDTASTCRYTMSEPISGDNSTWFVERASVEPSGFDYTDPAAASLNLGLANSVVRQLPPVPVLVRNGYSYGNPENVLTKDGGFLAVGELSRILAVGPGETRALDEAIFQEFDKVRAEPEHVWVTAGRLDWTSLPRTPLHDYTWSPPAQRSEMIFPRVPVGAFMSEYFCVYGPGYDTLDNDGDGVPDEEDERACYAGINLNTATYRSLQSLPFLGDKDELIRRILEYRDGFTEYGDPDNAPVRRPNGYYTAAHVLRATQTALNDKGLAPNTYDQKLIYNASDAAVSDSEGQLYLPAYADDDGLPDVVGDLTKWQAYYNRSSNFLTVRSDSYAVYLTVMRCRIGADGKTPDAANPTATRRYVAVLDRSQCNKRADLPLTLMCSEIK